MGIYSITYYVTMLCCYWWTRLTTHSTPFTIFTQCACRMVIYRWFYGRCCVHNTHFTLYSYISRWRFVDCWQYWVHHGARCNQIIIYFIYLFWKLLNANQMQIDLQTRRAAFLREESERERGVIQCSLDAHWPMIINEMDMDFSMWWADDALSIFGIVRGCRFN